MTGHRKLSPRFLNVLGTALVFWHFQFWWLKNCLGDLGRPLVADFVNAVVGERLGQVQLEAADALQNLFAEKVETTGGDAAPRR